MQQSVKAENKSTWCVQEIRKATVQQVTADVHQETSEKISVHRTPLCVGYGSRRAVRTPLMLQFTRENVSTSHKDRTVEDWQKIMWPNDSRFQLHWRNQSTKALNYRWWWQCYALEPLIRVERRLNSSTYLGIFLSCSSILHTRQWAQTVEAISGRRGSLWLPLSPDIYPIEDLWDELERAIQQLDPHPSNLAQVPKAIYSSLPFKISWN